MVSDAPPVQPLTEAEQIAFDEIARQGIIYFVEAGDFIKIGFTRSPWARPRALGRSILGG